MKKFFILLTILTFSLALNAQNTEEKTCDCAKLTMKGINGKAAFLDNAAYTGKCTMKNESGKITAEHHYNNGNLHGESKLFYPNGNLKEVTEYKYNLKTGKYLAYNEEKILITEGTYKNNLKERIWKYYDAKTGKAIKTINYEFGKEIAASNNK